MDASGIGRVAFNTTLAACAAGMTALFFAQMRTRCWSLATTTNGVLAGLVAITCPCYWVSPLGAAVIGAVGALTMCGATEALEYLRIDDPVGAVPVHLAAGVWGTLSLGLFATGQYGLPTATGADLSATVTGLFYGGGTGQLLAQGIGSGAMVGATLVSAWALMYGLKALGVLRISKHGELLGIDRHEHGAAAYPEFEPSASTQAGLALPVEQKTAAAGLARARIAR